MRPYGLQFFLLLNEQAKIVTPQIKLKPVFRNGRNFERARQ